MTDIITLVHDERRRISVDQIIEWMRWSEVNPGRMK